MTIKVEDGIEVPDEILFDPNDVASVVNAMEKIAGSKDYIKQVLDKVKSGGLNTKVFRKVCKAQFEKNYPDLKAENDLFEKAYEILES